MLEISNMLTIGLWLLAGIGMGALVGFFLGRSFTLRNESAKLAKERSVIFGSLTQLITSTEQMTLDVDRTTQSLVDVERDVKDIESTGDLSHLQNRLLHSIDRVVQTNHKMENDLAVTRYQLENQAQELDRSRKEARTDGLCNVGNRKAFEEAIGYMLSRFRSANIHFALLLVDLDHFKRINDTYGHQAGDEVLGSVGAALKECVRPEDIVTRIGGDEFAILLKDVNEKNVELVSRRIRETIELYNFSIGVGASSTVVTTSMGIAIIQPGEDPGSLYKRADEALYKSKERGRNCLTTASNKANGVTNMSEQTDSAEVNLLSILPTDTLPGFDDAAPNAV